MPQINGQRLLVNLGASQVRKRLKGHGWGVRQIQSAGKQQSVVIHTATGTHLQRLVELLAPYAQIPQVEFEEESNMGGLLSTDQSAAHQSEIDRSATPSSAADRMADDGPGRTAGESMGAVSGER